MERTYEEETGELLSEWWYEFNRDGGIADQG
jgi:hypothetical protein